MKRNILVPSLASLLVFTLLPSAFAQPPQQSTREITQITGDLYGFVNNNHRTVFLVTSEGIILADPLNVDAATWLKGQLAARFNVPVRYVLYSHHHFDHASGAAVFNETAELIAHENFNAGLMAATMSLRGGALRNDRNSTGRVERDETQGIIGSRLGSTPGGLAAIFDLTDRNSDGSVTAAEIYADVVPPETTYSRRRTVTLGGKTVQLVHPGLNHSDDATVLYFPAERIVFAVDYLTVKRLPGGLGGGAPLADWIASLKSVEALDFDTVVPGHGSVGTKADVAAYRQYFEDLVAAVSEGIAAGRTVEQLQASNILERYRDWPNYDPARNRTIAMAYEGLMAARR